MLNIVLDKPCGVTIRAPSEAFQVSFGLSKQENQRERPYKKELIAALEGSLQWNEINLAGVVKEDNVKSTLYV